MPIDIQAILKDLEGQIVDFAKKNVKEFATKAASDGKQLLATIKDDLGRWTQLLVSGQITDLEFKLLLKGQKDLIKMNALTEAGLTLVKIDEFKDGLINLIVSVITSAIKI